jgi:membrane-associated phospholipid phosphatase
LISSALLVFLLSSSLAAQSEPAPTPDESKTSPETQATDETPKPLQLPVLKKDDFFSRGFVHQMMADQKTIWTSPAHIKKSDAKWLLPLAAGTGVLLMEDTAISHHFDDKTSLQNTSTKVSNLGLYSTWGVPGAFLAIGKLGGNEHMVDTGEKGFQAAIYSTVVMQGLKVLTNRARPGDGGNGSFFSGGTSFPSGHSMEAWALAKVISDEYPNKRFVKIGMYSFATAISLSRITAERHYASDVLVGSALGYMIGNFVMRDHHHAEAAAQ